MSKNFFDMAWYTLEVEQAKKSAGLSEPSQISITNFRAQASRAKAQSKIFELERAEPKVQKNFPSPSDPSFGSSRRAKNEPVWAHILR